MGEGREDLRVAEEGVAEVSCGVRLVTTNEIEDFEKIFPRSGRDNDFVHGLPGATPGKFSSEFRKGNTLPRIQLSEAFVDGREGCGIGVFEHLRHGMIKQELSHAPFSVAQCRAPGTTTLGRLGRNLVAIPCGRAS